MTRDLHLIIIIYNLELLTRVDTVQQRIKPVEEVKTGPLAFSTYLPTQS